MRYVVFWGDSYYPTGGATDRHKQFNSEMEARAFARGIRAASANYDWVHVWDTQTDGIERIDTP